MILDVTSDVASSLNVKDCFEVNIAGIDNIFINLENKIYHWDQHIISDKMIKICLREIKVTENLCK